MGYVQFGNTWWGEKWLSTLERIDFSNRLPRGKSYARNGRVKEIKIDGNRILAKVKGTRSNPYKVKINLPKFNLGQQKRIKDLIVGNPYFLAKLLNRQLPEELFDALEKKGVRLFPSKWDDVEGNCSCPDWAVPCKHLASVIYLIANQIDLQPFTVLNLRGIKVEKLLKGCVGKKEEAVIAITRIEELMKVKPPNEESRVSKFSLDKFDLSTVLELDERLFELLPDKPPFDAETNLRTALAQIYKNLKKEAMNYEIRLMAKEKVRHPQVQGKLQIEVGGDLRWCRFVDEKRRYGWKDVIVWLEQVLLSDLKHHGRYVQTLALCWHLTLKLLQTGAFVPRLMEVKKGWYRIQWMGAEMDTKVKELMEMVENVCPVDWVKVTKRKKIDYLSKEEQVRTGIDIWLRYWFEQEGLKFKTKSTMQELWLEGKPFNSKSFDGQDTVEAMQLWLQRLFIAKKEWQPVLQVEDKTDGEFEVEVKMDRHTQPLDKPLAWEKFIKQKQYKKYKSDALRNLTLLTDQFPALQKVISSEGKEKVSFGAEEFAEVLFKVLPTLKLLGIRLVLPKGLDEVIRPKVSMSIKSLAGKTPGGLSVADMLRFNWQIAMGNKNVKVGEFTRLVNKSKGIIKWRDRFIYLDEQEITKLMKQLGKPPQTSAQEILRVAISGEYQGAKVNLSRETQKMINEWLDFPKLKVPNNLIAELRPYQSRGYSWLFQNAKLGFGSLLADDMGLGKTIQVIALLLQWKKMGWLEKTPSLIIVPTTLITNWAKELAKFAPDLQVHIYHGPQRKLLEEKMDTVITSYGLARRDVEKLKVVKWSGIILDEAQNIKNIETAQTKAIKQLKSGRKMALTGTPVENRLSEYWSIFDYLNPGYLPKMKDFITQYARPIELERDRQAAENFRKLTRPFIMRRLKTDKSIIADLPDKIVTDQYCNLGKQQTALYKALVDEIMNKVENAEGRIQKFGLVFKLMTGLKQICNHPAHYLKKGEPDPKLSGKAEMLMELLETIYQSGQKVLIFTQYTEMGKLLSVMLLKKFKQEPLFFHGGLNRKKRDEMVENFQKHDKDWAMILSLKAGGTGLNLTTANHVIHYDLWWNPAVETQATDRAYRIGQNKNVNVYRMVCSNTFEEKINAMIQTKKELSDLTVEVGEKWIGQLGNKELRELFKMGR